MTVSSKGTRGEPVISNPPTRIPDMSAIAAYAALVGNRIADSSSNRASFSSHFGFTPFDGLEYFEIDTGNIYIYASGTWVGVKGQAGLHSFGTSDYDPNGGGYDVSVAIAFVNGRFTNPPVVVPTVFTQAAANQHAGVADVTATGFTLYYWRATQIATTLGWVATPSDS